MIYLASPYSDPDYTVMEDRYRAVRDLTMDLLLNKNIYVFSPIMYCHRAAQELMNVPTNAESYKSINAHFQRLSFEMWVLALDGWEISKGVQMEIELAQHIGQPYKFVNAKGEALPRG